MKKFEFFKSNRKGRGGIVQLKSRSRWLVFSLVMLFLVPVAWAETVVTSLDGSATWNYSNQPYIVEGDLFVQSGETLTIEPGVEVRFNGPYMLTVYGRLLAEGEIVNEPDEEASITDVNWILFTQHDTTGIADEDRWGGIRFEGSESGSVLRYAIIEYGFAGGVWPYNNGGGLYIFGSSPQVENSVIRHCRADKFGGGVYMWSSSSLFRNNLIAHNSAVEQGGGIHMDLTNIDLRNLTVVDNNAEDFGKGIYFGPSSTPYIRSSIFWANGDDAGARDDEAFFNAGLSDADFRNSIVSGEYWNLGASVTVDGQDIENFLWGVVNQGIDNVFYPADTLFYTLSDSSVGIDNGDPFDDRWSVEPLPNGGENKINMGAYGGTLIAAKSLPVAGLIHPASLSRQGSLFPLPVVRVGETTSTVLGVINIGHGPLYVYHDSLSFEEPDEGEDYRDRFSVPEFSRIAVGPDSFEVFEVEYNPNMTDVDTMDVWLRLDTDGGTVRFLLRGVPINPSIRVEPQSIDFETVNLGTPDTLTYTVYSEGTTRVSLEPPVTYTSHFSVVSGRANIPPGETEVFSVVCNPIITVGELVDSVQIRNNDEMKYVYLTASSRGPILSTDVSNNDSLDFLFVDINDSRTLGVIYRNEGNADMVVTPPETLPDDFSLFADSEPFTSAISVAPSDSVEIGYRFSPSIVQFYSDSITVSTSLRNIKLYVQGRGTTGGVYFAGDIPNPDFGIPEVWGADGNDIYVCAGASTIPAGQTLTILDGVQVLFEEGNGITVEGVLEVLGKEGNEVVFTPQNGDDGSFHSGIYYFGASPLCRMQWAVVEYGMAASGGGIAVYNCSPSFFQVTVRNCVSSGDGGGMWVYQSAPSIIRCSIYDNVAATTGGGLTLWGSEPEFHNNLVYGNHADEYGGGIEFTSYSSPEITNSLIYDNSAGIAGGGIYAVDHSSPVLLNDIIYANTADSAAALRAKIRSNPILRNSVIHGHEGDVISHGEGGNLVARYSVVQGMLDPDNDVSDVEPAVAFVNAPNDFHLAPGSPLIDDGDPAGQYEDFVFPPSLGSERADIGLYGGRYAGYWDDAAPLKITFFNNIANARGLKIVVNVIGDIQGDPTLEVTTFSGTETATLTEIGSGAGAYYTDYSIEESTFLEAKVSANNGDFVFKRNIDLVLFKPASGGQISSSDGMSLIMPPNTVGQEIVVSLEPDLGASLPDDIPLSDPAGARWVISSPIEHWSSPAELVLPYDPVIVYPGSEQGLAIWRNIDDQWERIESYVDIDNKTVHGSIFGSGTYVITYEATGEYSNMLPVTSRLQANYPNPFNPVTTIPFMLSEPAVVDLRIYNVLGQEVTRLANDWYTAGQHNVTWQASSGDRELASGIYICRLKVHGKNGSGEIIDSRKIVLMR